MNLNNWIMTTEQPRLVPPGFRSGTQESLALLSIVDRNDPANAHHDHRLAADIAALMSVALGRKIDIPYEISIRVEGSDQTNFLPYGNFVDRTVSGPIPDDTQSGITTVMEQVQGLDGDDLAVIGAATAMFHGALLLHDRDVRAGYALLVAGVEILSRVYGEPPTEWEAWDKSEEWDAFIAQQDLSPEQGVAIRTKLLADKQLRLRGTFKRYAATRLPPDFWQKDWIEWMYPFLAAEGTWDRATTSHHCKIRDFLPDDRKGLERALGTSYDLRSSYVHEGRWFSFPDLTLDARQMIDFRKPLPFALLRAILQELLLTEIGSNSTSQPLPDVKLCRNWQPSA